MKYKEIETAEDAERKEANKAYHDELKSIKDKGDGHACSYTIPLYGVSISWRCV